MINLNDEVMTLQEAAEFLKVSYSTVQHMTKSGELHSWHPNNNKRIVRVLKSDLIATVQGTREMTPVDIKTTRVPGPKKASA